MNNMNKEKLIEKLQKNGWNVEIEHNKNIVTCVLNADRTEISFSKISWSYAKQISAYVTGEKLILEEDFISIIEYLKVGIEHNSLLIDLETQNSTENVRETLVNYLQKNGYELVDLSKKRRKLIIGKNIVYATKESINEIDHYNEFYLALRDVLYETYHSKVLFDYRDDTLGVRDGIRYFVNIYFHKCIIFLKRNNDTLELSILDNSYKETIENWKITKKEEIKTFIQPYIDKMEQKQRVKVLFETLPDYFFDKYSTLNRIGFEVEYKRKIYDALLTQYSPLEIEYLCAKYCKYSERKTKIYKNGNYFFFFDGKTIVVNREEKTVTIVENEQKVN